MITKIHLVFTKHSYQPFGYFVSLFMAKTLSRNYYYYPIIVMSKLSQREASKFWMPYSNPEI